MTNNMKNKLLLASIGLILTSSALADDVTYRKHIQPLWQAKCSACHGVNAPYAGDFGEDKEKYKKMQQGPRMDTYADLIFFVGWPDTGALMRRLDDGNNTKDGKPGNMYQHLGASDEERQKNFALFKAWVGEDAWFLNRWKQRNDVPGVTKEQLLKLKLEY